ncbi:hypothetical protein R3P38DRAFT_3236144 [Favolaschia claudopus]|uniref:Uncharacterized protein n=1 Tax=Favolaschia claudopus TaxID=2862362 RepID=A0AAV9ZD23_9AGAR
MVKGSTLLLLPPSFPFCEGRGSGGSDGEEDRDLQVHTDWITHDERRRVAITHAIQLAAPHTQVCADETLWLLAFCWPLWCLLAFTSFPEMVDWAPCDPLRHADFPALLVASSSVDHDCGFLLSSLCPVVLVFYIVIFLSWQAEVWAEEEEERQINAEEEWR